MITSVIQISMDAHYRISCQRSCQNSFLKALLDSREEVFRDRTADYDLLMERGSDSKFYDNDLLSVIGYEAGRFDVLRDYYASNGNRTAELLATVQLLRQERTAEMEPLDDSPYLQRLDSLIGRFSDLEACGEAAIERYSFMERQTRATAEQKIAYIDEAICRWGSWPRMNELRNKRLALTALHYNASAKQLVTATGQWTDIELTAMRGVTDITMRVYSVKADGTFPYDAGKRYEYEEQVRRLLTPQPNLTQTVALGTHKDYELFDSCLRLPPLPIGVYMIELESTPKTNTSRQLLFVSDVRIITQPMPDRKLRIVAVNAISGQPLAKAKLEITSHTGYYSDRQTFKVTTDDKGEYIYTRQEKENSCSIFATHGKDCYCRTMRQDGGFSYYEGSPEGYSGSVYTDRRVYRPGQTVHAAAILYRRYEKEKHAVEEGLQVTMELHDANGKLVAEKNATTDGYGTCTADFTLPKTGLAGKFSVKAVCRRGDNKNNSTYSCDFRVEEYKRPTFEVEMPRVKTAYTDGDTVSVVGTARTYAGVKVQGAKVKYKVVRRRAYWWFSYYSYWNQMTIGRDSDDKVLAEGETETGADGTFTVGVPIEVPKTRYTMFYNFEACRCPWATDHWH